MVVAGRRSPSVDSAVLEARPVRAEPRHARRSATGNAHAMPHVAGFDGVRALAALAVMGVHQQFTWMPGGFYGVDAFFTLSGFLITSLLVREVAGTGTIRLGAFWARRARRLLPALLLLVMVVGLVSAFDPSLISAPSFPGALATLFYSANWYFVFAHVNYFAITGAPSPLLHTWSLAIEEQFYLLWPLIVLGVIRFGHRRATTSAADFERHFRRRMSVLLALAAGGALVSAVAMWVITPTFGDPSAAYYGTGTRAQGVLIGSAIALAVALWGRPRRPAARRGLALASLAGVGVTLFLWTNVAETSPLAFHGGFVLASLAAGAVVANVASFPKGLTARVLSVRLLRRLGVISYGVYLWYWPVILAMSPQRMHLGPYALFAVRFAVTVGIATLSYFLVEAPIRYGKMTRRTTAWAIPAAMGLAAAAMAVAAIQPSNGVPEGPVNTALASANPAVAAHRAVKVLLVGDSAAGSLGVGLGAAAPRYGIQLMNDGHPGCSVSLTGENKVLWYTVPPGQPCSTQNPNALLDSWKYLVDHYNPDVVIYLARSDLLDQTVAGRWEHVGQPSFDTYLQWRLHEMISVLSERGAAVVLLTEPYYNAGDTQTDAWPEDQPERVLAADRIIRRVAAHFGVPAPRRGSLVAESTGTTHTGSLAGSTAAAVRTASAPRVAVFNLGAMISPGDRFADDVDGVTMRCADGVHFTEPGGALVARRLFPTVRQLAVSHFFASPGGTWPGPPPPTTPAWWFKLPCT